MALEALHGPADAFRLIAVSGGTAGCDSAVGNAAPGPLLVDAVAAVGGDELLICDPAWPTDLASSPAFAPNPPNTWTLSESPVVGVLLVRVNDVPNTAWTYQPDPPRLVFPPGQGPPADATLTATYPADDGC